MRVLRAGSATYFFSIFFAGGRGSGRGLGAVLGRRAWSEVELARVGPAEKQRVGVMGVGSCGDFAAVHRISLQGRCVRAVRT